MRIWPTFCITSFAISMIIAIFLIGFSLETVQILKNGLEFNPSVFSIDSTTLYSSGRYIAGVGHSFVQFPSTIQLMVFSTTNQQQSQNNTTFDEESILYSSITARTSDGLSITVDVTLFYKLGLSNSSSELSNDLYNLYLLIGNNWNQLISDIVQSKTKDVMAHWNATQFYLNQSTIESDLFNTVNASLATQYISLSMICITDVTFPDEFTAAIDNQEVVLQESESLRYLYNTTLVQANTSLLLAANDSQMIINNATTNGLLDYYQKQSIANATIQKYSLLNQALYQIASSWGLTNDYQPTTNIGSDIPTKLLTFYWIYVLKYGSINATLNLENPHEMLKETSNIELNPDW